MTNTCREVVGIDFSGAKFAGRHIWLSIGHETKGSYQIHTCEQATEFFDCPSNKSSIYNNLVDWIHGLQNTTIGMDFPFGIPEIVATQVFNVTSWRDLVESSKWNRLNPDDFRDEATDFSNNELRDTDAVHRADCPHSIRIYKQTFHGIRDVLQPLLERDVAIAPMAPSSRSVTVLETYPAATLGREESLYATRYKNHASNRNRRKHNVETLARFNDLNLTNISLDKVVEDRKGDALDSIIAGLATSRAVKNSKLSNVQPMNPIEGHIFA